MNNAVKYNEIIQAKNGTTIPVFNNGKTVDSKYNPEREADTILSTITKNYNFYIVIGIGSGVLINKLLEKNNNCKIVAVENSTDDIKFLMQIKLIQKLSNHTNIIFTDINTLEENIINNYLPAIYGELRIIEQKGWSDNHKELISVINNKLNHSIGIISADYSVQSHFGKIWQNNILNNLKELSVHKFIKNEINNNKTALIVAAGPSLDSKINYIKLNRNNFVIIATDTAYSILIKNNIIPDIALSIDGQFISNNHFTKINNETIFLVDLCSNHTISSKLLKKNCKVHYFISGHPLSSLANNLNNNKFLYLFSGAGTVTITSLDLALKLGFEHIQIVGADFGYLKGKSYGKGSYFDLIFGKENNKLKTIENKYDNLMYRTELHKISNEKYSTTVLNAYKLSLESYLIENHCSFNIENNLYKITCKQNRNKSNIIFTPMFNYNNFILTIKKSTIEELTIPLLPFIAWLRNNNKYKNNDFNCLLKLAQSHIVSYN